jgi:heme-degrading monooxygenase HmoA
MIARIWRGLVKTEEAEDYIRHLQNDTVPQLSRIPGFVSASILRKHSARGVEFIVLTTWQSMDAIRQFTGETIDLAVVPQVAQAMMVEYDQTVSHYEIAGTFTAPTG